jgi:sugar transferase EpsL
MMTRETFYVRYIKGTIDRLLAAAGLICFCWLYLIIAIAIKIDDPKGPVIFKQERLGKNGHVYWMYKFRSMKVGAEHTGSGVYSDGNDTRVTRVGRVLRATSLDEIPQLWNLLKGEMALIGFRSPLTYHPWPWEEYTEEQRKMFELKPGITGWAQVNGRKTVEWNHRIKLNIWYAENVSFLLDLKILFMTVIKVFSNADNENVGETVKK